MSHCPVTVFGGGGFLGRSIVRHLLESGRRVRLASRRPAPPADNAVSAAPADVRDEAGVAAAVEGSRAVVNAVGLYLERAGDTFAEVHVQGAATVARRAAAAGVETLVHVSGIGASPGSPSAYVRARAAGERAVRRHFNNALIVRASVLYGPGDSLLSGLDRITRRTPVFPLFGRGRTRLQAVYVEDVALAIRHLLQTPPAAHVCYELGGPRAYRYKELVELVLRYRRRRCLLLPVPFAVWALQARLMRGLPNPPLTVDQVVLMRGDNVVGAGAAGFAELGLRPRALEALLPVCLGPEREARA